MTKLPSILAAEYCVDCVEDISRDVRLSAWDAIRRMNAAPEKFPRADWLAIDRKEVAIQTVLNAWLA